MTTDINSPDYEHVNHPAHYNGHPSGVEAIELCEVMEFNTGNAFKYLFRAGSKGKALQDTEKALWYINREIDRLEQQDYTSRLSLQEFMKSNYLFTSKHVYLASVVVKSEDDFTLKSIYSTLLSRQTIPDRVSGLIVVRLHLESMIKEMRSSQDAVSSV